MAATSSSSRTPGSRVPDAAADSAAPDAGASGTSVAPDASTASSAGSRVPAQKKLSLAHRLYTGDLSYSFVPRWKRWFAISGTLVLISVLALLVRHLNLGIEFKGGTDFQATTPITSTTTNTVRDAVLHTNLPRLDGVQVTTMGSNTVKAATRSLSASEVGTVRGAIASALHTSSDKVTYNLIGPSWGHQITSKALQALIVFLILVTALIWIYFRDWRMSVAGIVALIHDLVLTIGIYALVGFEVSSSTVIGVLTILGYSLYDTVVVFDKVRENVDGVTKTRRTYSEAANDAVNQVLVRSLNTTVIGVLPVAAILFAGAVLLGSGPLEDLGLALFVGMISGAYSSIFIATPLLALLKEASPEMRRHRAALAGSGEGGLRSRRIAEREARKAAAASEVEAVDPSAAYFQDEDDDQQPGATAAGTTSVTGTSAQPARPARPARSTGPGTIQLQSQRQQRRHPRD